LIFEEKNPLPSDHNETDDESKDFVEKRKLDLPIRRRADELLIRRRRWRRKITGQILK
jgi:hypothetical protein